MGKLHCQIKIIIFHAYHLIPVRFWLNRNNFYEFSNSLRLLTCRPRKIENLYKSKPSGTHQLQKKVFKFNQIRKLAPKKRDFPSLNNVIK